MVVYSLSSPLKIVLGETKQRHFFVFRFVRLVEKGLAGNKTVANPKRLADYRASLSWLTSTFPPRHGVAASLLAVVLPRRPLAAAARVAAAC